MEKIKRNLWLAAAALVIVMIGFLHYQVDDEIYYGVHELENVTKSADTSEGTIIVDAAYQGVYASTPVLGLAKGTYYMEIDHQGKVDTQVAVLNHQKVVETFTLPADELLTRLQFQLDRSSDWVQIQFLSEGQGDFTFKHMNFSTDGSFYSDSIFAAALAILILIMGTCYVRSSGQKRTDREKAAILASVALAVFLSYPLYNNFLNYAQDIEFHLMRIEGLRDGILSGQFPVQIYPGNMKDHGYLGSLYPSLFLYIPALLRVMGVSMVTAYKFLLFLINLGTMGSAYYAGKTITKSRQIALIGMFLYALAPYRLVNVYIRGALGESIAMIFLPIVIAGLYELLLGNQKRWYVLTLGLTGLMESHVLSGLLMGVLCVCFVLFYVKKLFAEKRILSMAGALALTVLLNMGFLIPFLYYYSSKLKMSALSMFGFYEMSSFPAELFMMNATMNDAEVMRSGIAGELVTGIGIAGVIGIALTICYFALQKEKKQEETRLMGFLFFMEAAYLYAATSWFPWQTLQKIGLIDKLLVMIQFPWRTLGIVAVLGAVVTAAAICQTRLLREHRVSICVVLLILSLTGGVTIMDAYLEQDVKYTKLTGEIGDAPHGEYAPEKADLNSLTWADDMEYTDDALKITEYDKKGSSISFSYEGNNTQTSAALPMFYYKGFSAKLNTGEILPVSESEKGLIQIDLPAGDSVQNVVVTYQQPRVFYVGYLLSFLGMGTMIFLIFRKKRV